MTRSQKKAASTSRAKKLNDSAKVPNTNAKTGISARKHHRDYEDDDSDYEIGPVRKKGSTVLRPHYPTRKSRSTSKPQSPEKNPDEHNEICEVCNKGGDLLCCDTCSLVFHVKCIRPLMPEIPRGNWSCAHCVLDDSTQGDKEEAEKAVNKMKRLSKGLSSDGEQDSSSTDDNHKLLNGNEEITVSKSGKHFAVRKIIRNKFFELGRYITLDEALSSIGASRKSEESDNLMTPTPAVVESPLTDGVSTRSAIAKDSALKKANKNKKNSRKNTPNKDETDDSHILCDFCVDDPLMMFCGYCGCKKCYGKEDVDNFIVCELCGRESHSYCTVPPLPLKATTVEKENWCCENCLEKKSDSLTPSFIQVQRSDGDNSIATILLSNELSFGLNELSKGIQNKNNSSFTKLESISPMILPKLKEIDTSDAKINSSFSEQKDKDPNIENDSVNIKHLVEAKESTEKEILKQENEMKLEPPIIQNIFTNADTEQKETSATSKDIKSPTFIGKVNSEGAKETAEMNHSTGPSISIQNKTSVAALTTIATSNSIASSVYIRNQFPDNNKTIVTVPINAGLSISIENKNNSGVKAVTEHENSIVNTKPVSDPSNIGIPSVLGALSSTGTKTSSIILPPVIVETHKFNIADTNNKSNSKKKSSTASKKKPTFVVPVPAVKEDFKTTNDISVAEKAPVDKGPTSFDALNPVKIKKKPSKSKSQSSRSRSRKAVDKVAKQNSTIPAVLKSVTGGYAEIPTTNIPKIPGFPLGTTAFPPPPLLQASSSSSSSQAPRGRGRPPGSIKRPKSETLIAEGTTIANSKSQRNIPRIKWSRRWGTLEEGKVDQGYDPAFMDGTGWSHGTSEMENDTEPSFAMNLSNVLMVIEGLDKHEVMSWEQSLFDEILDWAPIEDLEVVLKALQNKKQEIFKRVILLDPDFKIPRETEHELQMTEKEKSENSKISSGSSVLQPKVEETKIQTDEGKKVIEDQVKVRENVEVKSTNFLTLKANDINSGMSISDEKTSILNPISNPVHTLNNSISSFSKNTNSLNGNSDGMEVVSNEK